jgi:hypothetical protein
VGAVSGLTREQIEQEPVGRQLDAWVAQYVMDWHRVWDGDRLGRGLPTAESRSLGWSSVPLYSAHIQDAWDVLLHIHHDPNRRWLFSRRQAFYREIRDQARFKADGTDETFTVAWPDALGFLAERMPEVICKAALYAAVAS